MVTTATEPLKTIRANQLKQLIQADQVILIDVREPEEYAAEHIPGAILMPLSQFEPAQVPVASDKQTMLYCRSGNRSGKAAQKLLAAGWREVTHLGRGIGDWKEAGYDVVSSVVPVQALWPGAAIVAGLLILVGTLLGALVSSWFLTVNGLVAVGLLLVGGLESRRFSFSQQKVSP
jgi:rhodanese-related sulfurtransferase